MSDFLIVFIFNLKVSRIGYRALLFVVAAQRARVEASHAQFVLDGLIFKISPICD